MKIVLINPLTPSGQGFLSLAIGLGDGGGGGVNYNSNMLTIQREGRQMDPPIGFADLKFEAINQSKRIFQYM